MGNRRRIAVPLLIAASLLFAATPPRPACAGETAEIPAVPSSQAVHADSVPAPAALAPPGDQLEQDNGVSEPPGVQEYMSATEQISVFGIDLRVDTRRAGRDVQGLLVVDVASGSPGAAAGLHPFRQRTRDVLNGVGMLAAMAFPPAMVVVPLVESVPLHESYDLIIGVDGWRVANFVDLWERMRNVRPGEIVYLNVLRDGHRVQLPMRVTSAVPPPDAWAR